MCEDPEDRLFRDIIHAGMNQPSELSGRELDRGPLSSKPIQDLLDAHEIEAATLARIFSEHTRVQPSGCIEWTGSTRPNGYGRLEIGRNRFSALSHRVAYFLAHGPIPEGLVIDHVCRNASCVNVDHLEAVTPKENTLRGNGVTAKNAVKTRCDNGHELSGDNLRITKEGFRVCRTCKRLWWRRKHGQGKWRVDDV